MIPKIGIVVPCYNEEAILHDSAHKLEEKLQHLIQNEIIHQNSFVVFVNDGSKDATWSIIKDLVASSNLLVGLNLSKNVGHQNAVYAGIQSFYQKASALISIDADLQDDIQVIDEMVAHFKAGSEIVYGVRKNRTTDTWFKRMTASQYYNLLQAMKVDIVKHHADFRLTSTAVNAALMNFQESHLFLRGIFPKMGYSHSFVYYDRLERLAGESKYPLKKMATIQKKYYRTTL
jgi:glycosyltransferase involved in cell wall biosynthesis